jgi:hypothetical protein
MGGSAVPVGVLLERYSWQIWRQPSTGIEEYREPQTTPEAGATVTLTRSPEMGTLPDATLSTDSEGRAWTMFAPDGGAGGVSIEAAAGDSTATLFFDIAFPDDYNNGSTEESWSYSHTEATLVAELSSPLPTYDLAAGESRDLALSVRYETWDVEISNHGNTRTENHTSAPAEGAGVTWTIESGDGSVSGYGTSDAAGMVQGSLTMGSGETIVRADLSYATGQATSATLTFTPQTYTGGAGGSSWTQIGTEIIPSIVNLSVDGSSDLYSGETRQFTGMVWGEVWDLWTDGVLMEQRYNYSTPLSFTTVHVESMSGDGSISPPTFTTDGSGWFSSSYTMGSGPAILSLRVAERIEPAATIAFSHLITGDTGNTGSGTGPTDDFVYLRTEGAYSIEGLSVDGPTYDLASGEVRTISGTLVWTQWELWQNTQGHTESRHGTSSPAAWTPLAASISQGDGALSSSALTTGSMGEFSTQFTMGQENSTVALSVDGPQGTSATVGFTRPAPPEIWTKIRDESSIVVALAADDGGLPREPGHTVPLKATVTATTWEIRQSGTTGELREFDRQTGPAIASTVDFALLSGPGSLVAAQAETDADGIAVVDFVLGESAATLRATAAFQTASSTAEVVVSPGIWVRESSHEDLDLSLAVLGNPATGLEALVQHRTWEVWRNTATGGTELRHQSIAPAANAEVVFVRLDGGTPAFAPNPAFTNVSGVATTTYQSDAALNVSVTAGFAGLTKTSALAVPQGWGVVGGGGTGGGGTGGGGTGGGGTGGGGTGGGGTGGGGTGGGGTGGGGTGGGTGGGGTGGGTGGGGGQNPTPQNLTFTLRGHGLEYR